MASKDKEVRLEQKAYLETKLNQRLSALADRDLKPGIIAKDPAVRKIRAEIRETDSRLMAITALEKKAEEMARIKAEKIAALKKEEGKKKKGKAEKEPETSKRQQKKKAKKETKAAKSEASSS